MAYSHLNLRRIHRYDQQIHLQPLTISLTSSTPLSQPATSSPPSHTTRQLEQYSLFEKDKLCVAIALPSYTYMLLYKAKCINENLQVIYCDTFAYNYFIHLKIHDIMVCLNGLHLCAHSHERFTKYLVINYFSNYFEDNKQNKKGITFYRERVWGWD